MTAIDGVSQTTGIERIVEVSAAPDGVRVTIRDRKLGTELASAAVPAEWLMNVLADAPDGPQVSAGDAGPALAVEVRRNEVWLTLGGPDAAVGLDDLTDAVAAAVPA